MKSPRHRSARALPGAFALCLCLLSAPAARAQESTAPLAEALFQQGRSLMAEGEVDKACTAFARSYELDRSVGAVLNLAVCNEKRGRTATAWAQFATTRALAQRNGQKKRAAFADERAKALEARLATVMILASEPPTQLVVSVDGERVDSAALGVALPLDPGRHEIEIGAPGKKPWTTTLDVPDSKVSLTLEVPELEDAGAEPAPAPSGPSPELLAPDPSPSSAADANAEPDTLGLGLMIGGFSLAGVGIVVGAITGGLSLSQTSDVKATCVEDLCEPAQRDAIDEATTLANVSNVAFAIAGAGAVAGIVGLLLPEDDATVDVAIGPGGVFVRGTF